MARLVLFSGVLFRIPPPVLRLLLPLLRLALLLVLVVLFLFVRTKQPSLFLSMLENTQTKLNIFWSNFMTRLVSSSERLNV